MKSIFNKHQNQIEDTEAFIKGINPLNQGIERVFLKMKNRPSLVIWGIWIFIFFIDLIIRFGGGIPRASFPLIIVHFSGGIVFSLFLFFHFLPKVFIRKKWILVSLQLLVLMIVYLVIKYYTQIQYSNELTTIRKFLGNETSRFFHYAVYIIFIWVFYIDGKRQELNKKMEVEQLKLKIEQKSLQLSSHFVLNWISSFFIAVKKVSPELSQQLSIFTEVLSYNYKNPNHPNSLGQEIRAVKSYLESQQFRFKNRLNLKMSCNLRGTNLTELHFPKWTLMTLVENIFKHGDCFNPDRPCLVSLDLYPSIDEGDSLVFCITNDLNTAIPVTPSGFGIQTVERILSYYFPNRYQLLTYPSETEYCLFLEVKYNPVNF